MRPHVPNQVGEGFSMACLFLLTMPHSSMADTVVGKLGVGKGRGCTTPPQVHRLATVGYIFK